MRPAATLSALAAALGLWASGPPARAAAPPPKLIVAISIDQFGANLFDQWRNRFTGGLRRLESGVVYASGYQSHAATETCPGHSTLLTGKHPNKTGIVANDYRDPDTGREVYCLQDSSTTLADDPARASVGPQRLLATTLGDWLKASSPANRVVAVSSKDRGAINMAGHAPDGVYWLAPGFGFTTYLRPGETAAARLAPVAAVNARAARTWTARPTWKYAHTDCRALAGAWTFGQTRWESRLPPDRWGTSTAPKDIQADVMASPIPDQLTLQAARALIDGFRLGRGPGVDVLAVSFSATDYVGHRYGADGPEMCENLHALDEAVGALLAKLDATRVPYLVVLSADHGGSDFAERLQAKGYPAGRVDGRAVLEAVNRTVSAELGLTGPAPLAGPIEELNVVEAHAADKARIAAAAARALAARPEIAAAFTQEELLATPIPRDTPPDELSLKERFAESTYRGRSPDVVAALRPYLVSRSATPGAYLAGHGTVWNYDRRVPILFWWPGATPQERGLPIETVDIAPTLAAVLGLTPPSDIDGHCRPLPWGACPSP